MIEALEPRTFLSATIHHPHHHASGCGRTPIHLQADQPILKTWFVKLDTLNRTGHDVRLAYAHGTPATVTATGATAKISADPLSGDPVIVVTIPANVTGGETLTVTVTDANGNVYTSVGKVRAR